MATAAVGVGTLRELSSLESDGHPVLSVYLDLDTTRFPTPAARDAELSALLSHADAHNADAEQICGLLDAQPKLTRGAPARRSDGQARRGPRREKHDI